MAVLINYKICDNAEECGGIAVCPTGALSWNKDKESIEIDNDKCISCGLCEKECPIGAILVAKNDEEYDKLKKEIDDDPRTTKDLFVDRYGAAPISDFFEIEMADIEEKTSKDCLTMIEVYSSDTIECLLKSIPIKDLTQNLSSDTLYYKAEYKEDLDKYGIKKLPALLFFQKGKLLGHIDGYYTTLEKDELVNKINLLLDK